MKKVNSFIFILSLCSLFFLSCENDSDNLLQEFDEHVQKETSKQTITTPGGHSLRRCGTAEHTAKLLENPEYKKQHELKFQRLANAVQMRACDSPVLLPVAVHFQGVSSPDVACLRQLAQSQISILNNDYQGINSDISNWQTNASSFPGISNGEACLEFKLATKNHPSGFNLNDGDPAVTINQTNGDNNNAWSGYINIFVQFNTGVLGYSPLGGSGNGDGVVIDASAFGKGNGCGNIAPQSPYNLGRTLTHELGHYLLLDHIWGNGCNADDGISDTPDANQAYYGCPSVGAASCGSTDLHMNYMDYTNDACMYMFSAGQASRMVNYVNSSLNNVVNNASNVLGSGGGGNTPSCSDGIQNGDETGVDCGGSCAPCEVTPTCSDGIQNGDETGVDCGGSCAPCDNTSECTAPLNNSVEILSNIKVRVSWTAIADAIRYRLAYRPVGTSQWTVKSTINNTKVLNNLTPGTTYEYRLRTRCADGSWTTWGTKSTFSLDGNGGGNGNCEEVSLQLILDDYGSETSWEVYDDFGAVVASGGPYQDFQNGKKINATFCLEDGCYTFVIYDDYGDGICCDWGEGHYQLTDSSGASIAASDGYFGTYEEISFCTLGQRANSVNQKRDEKKKNLAPKKARK